MKMIVTVALLGVLSVLARGQDVEKFKRWQAQQATAKAQQPVTNEVANPSSLSLTIKEVGSKKAVNYALYADENDYEKTEVKSKNIEAELRHGGHGLARGTALEVLWIAHDHDTGTTFVMHRDFKQADLKPSDSIIIQSRSPETRLTEQNFSMIGHHSLDGAEPLGYIVRSFFAGTARNAKASGYIGGKLVLDMPKIDALVKEYTDWLAEKNALVPDLN